MTRVLTWFRPQQKKSGAYEDRQHGDNSKTAAAVQHAADSWTYAGMAPRPGAPATHCTADYTESVHFCQKRPQKKKRTFVYEYCQKEYEAFDQGKGGNRFCSKKCQMHYRRENRLDFEKRICQFCGKEFETRKDNSTKCCSMSCARKMYFLNKAKN